MDYTKESPVILSLCPGMRGLERGVERAFERLNWRQPTTAAYVEIEAFIIQNLVGQMEQGLLAPAPIWSNVKTAPWEVFRDKIDFIFGGYPCQPFSVAGRQNGVEDPRHLWPYIAEGIRTIRPVGCFFENVRNHLNIGYETVRNELQEMGYNVREGIYSAEEVGAPHRRDRLFILAIRTDQLENSRSESVRNSSGGLHSTVTLASSELGNSAQSNKQRTGLCQELREREIGRSGCEMGYASEQRLQSSRLGRVGELSEKNRKRLDGGFEQSGNELANTVSVRLRTQADGEQRPEQFNESRWPARPGQDQYDWEKPRVKSRVGFTTHGYNYREDLLRMAGNGVVEQTAELAFIDLLNKHINPNK